MCILIACPPNRTPDLSDLWDAAEQNPDGHGWAIRTNGHIERMVSMDSDRAIGTFLSARERWPQSWAIWHSRFATQGTMNTQNCQPFEVPGQGWVMAHNGILPLSDGPFDGRRSDSRILAEDHLPQTSWQTMRHRFSDLDAWFAPSKVVVMSAGREKGGPVIIFGENRGTWAKDGCWWSARPYVYLAKSWTTKTAEYLKDAKWDDEEEECWAEYKSAERELERMGDLTDPDLAYNDR